MKVYLLFLLFFLLLPNCSHKLRQEEVSSRQPAVELSNPRFIEGELRVQIKNIHILKGDSLIQYNTNNQIPADYPPTLLLWSAQIRPFTNQRDINILFRDPAPTRQFVDSKNKNPILFWDLSSLLNENDSIIVRRRFNYICYDYRPAVSIDTITWDWHEIPDSIRTFYTKNEEFIQQTDSIKQTAIEITQKEKNVFKQARLLHHWLVKNMTYIYPPKKRGAVAALRSMQGDCGQYADLFIALARSLEIPARLQAGFVFYKERISYHVWTEIYLPHYGWFPVDPTRKNGFGYLDNKRLIASVGMNIPLKYTPSWATYLNSEVEQGHTDFMQLVTIVKSGFSAKISTKPIVLKDSLIIKPGQTNP